MNNKNLNKEIRKMIGKSITHEITSVKYRHKKTGEIATQIPMMSMGDWERADKGEPKPKKPSKDAPFSSYIQHSIDVENWRRKRRF